MPNRRSVLITIVFLSVAVFGLNNTNLNRCLEQNGTCVPSSQCKQAMEVNICNPGANIPLDASNKTGVCCLVLKRKVGEISKQKCEESYKGKVIDEELDELIVSIIGGGYNATPGEYPHMAALGYGIDNDITWGCAGSLISERFVLTAAHCIHSILGDVKLVRLGTVYLDSDKKDAHRQDFKISRVFVHPVYKPPSFYNDIALIELEGTVNVGDDDIGRFVSPACLQTEKGITNRKWKSTGWGEIYYNGPAAKILQVIDLEETDREICKRSFNGVGPRNLERGIDEDTQLCARRANGDVCQGDSGGPLQIRNPDFHIGYTVIGVTSFGPPCLLTSLGGVYTRVSHYIEWIESIVWPEQ